MVVAVAVLNEGRVWLSFFCIGLFLSVWWRCVCRGGGSGGLAACCCDLWGWAAVVCCVLFSSFFLCVHVCILAWFRMPGRPPPVSSACHRVHHLGVLLESNGWVWVVVPVIRFCSRGCSHVRLGAVLLVWFSGSAEVADMGMPG